MAEKKYISDNPELLAEWDWEKNSEIGLFPDKITQGSHKIIWWKCQKGHNWKDKPNNRTSVNNGKCPYCSNRKVLKGYNDLVSTNPSLAKEWHPTKNGELHPYDVSAFSGKKVWWVCKKCGYEWPARLADRSKGSQCPVCAHRVVWSGVNDLQTLRPDLAKEWHPTKNGDIKPSEVSIGSSKKVWWVCKKCGYEWPATIGKRTSGRNCPVCTNHAVWSGVNDLQTLRPELAKEWHPTKNGDIKPSEVSIGSNKKVWWICQYGHEWPAYIYNRASGSSCPVCTRITQSSFPEQTIFFYIKKAFPDAINGFNEIFKNQMELDIYIPSIQLAIEYDGIAWHNTDDDKKRECHKYSVCKANNIKLIRVVEDKNEEFMSEETCDSLININSTPTNEELDSVVLKLFKIISCFPVPSVDTRRDSLNIKEQYKNRVIENSIASCFPSVADEWHPTKNGKLKPDMFTSGSNEYIWWKCALCKNEWKSRIADRTRGRGCPACGSVSRKESRRKTLIKKRKVNSGEI